MIWCVCIRVARVQRNNVEGKRLTHTISSTSSFVICVVAQYRLCLVQQFRYCFWVRTFADNLLEELYVVSSTRFDNDFGW